MRWPPLEGYCILITWEGGEQDTVDMTGTISRFVPMAPLEDPEVFAKARVNDYGGSVGWPDGLDIGSDTLLAIARAQEPMTGEEFAKWMRLSSRRSPGRPHQHHQELPQGGYGPDHGQAGHQGSGRGRSRN